MKKYSVLIFAIAAVWSLLLSSCGKNNEIEDPYLEVQLLTSEDSIWVGKNLRFSIDCDADFLSYYDGTGVPTNPDPRQTAIYGIGKGKSLNIEKKEVTWSYTDSSKREVVFIARNVGDNGETIKETVKRINLTVLDKRSYPTSVKIMDEESKASTGQRYYSYPAIIDYANQTVIFEVPEGTVFNKVKVNIVVGDGSVIASLNGVAFNTSEGPFMDFTNPIDIKFTAYNSEQVFRFSFVTKPGRSDKELLSLKFTGASSPVVIDRVNHTITSSFPFGLSKSAVVKGIVSPGAFLYSGKKLVLTKAIDLSNATFRVEAEDYSSETYTCTVTTDSPFTSFFFASLNPVVYASVDDALKTVELKVHPETDVTKLIPTFKGAEYSTVTNTSNNDSIVVSGKTKINFTNPVIFKVKPKVGTTVNYTVSVAKLSK